MKRTIIEVIVIHIYIYLVKKNREAFVVIDVIGLKIRQTVSVSVLVWKSKTYQSIKKQIMEHL